MAPKKIFSKRPPFALYEKPATKRRKCGAKSMEERAMGQSYIPLDAKLKRTDVQAKKAYISSRCDMISGLSVDSCLGLQVPTARGESTYRFRDIRYDLRKGLIAIQTTDLAEESIMPLVVDIAIPPDNQAIQETHVGVAVLEEQALVPPNDMQDVFAMHMSERILFCMAIVHGLLIQRRSATKYPAQVFMFLCALIASGFVMLIMGMAGANAEHFVHVYKLMFFLYMLLDFQIVVLEGSGLCVGCAT